MAFAVSLATSLLLTLLVAESNQQLTILHSYPEPDNFSYVELVCVTSDSSQLVQSSSVVSGARFQFNGTDIERDDEIVVTLSHHGYLLLLLTQEKEGFLTCSHNNVNIC